MILKQILFGHIDNKIPVHQYTIQNSKGTEICVMPYGATLLSVKTADRNQQIDEVTLGFDSLEAYLDPHPCFGVIVGRFANRIAGGVFQLDGKTFHLAKNENGVNHLHGGNKGFDKMLWQAESFHEEKEAGVRLTYQSPDGEEGYPGTLDASVEYRLNEENELFMEYTATTDAPTIINLTNHAYWNLKGKGTALDHQLMLNSRFYLPVDIHKIPTGDLEKVSNSPMDFSSFKPVRKDLDQLEKGYDHCFVIDRNGEGLAMAAELFDPESGRAMEVHTTQPGIQFYSGNYIEGVTGRGGVSCHDFDGLCLETQFYPDAIHQPGFPSCVLRPGETYHHVTVHRFFVR